MLAGCRLPVAGCRLPVAVAGGCMRCGLAPGCAGAMLRGVVGGVHRMPCAQHPHTTHRTPHTAHRRLGAVDWPIPGARCGAVSGVASLWRMVPRHPASHAPPRLMRHAAAALAVGAWCPAPGRAEARKRGVQGCLGSGPCGWGRAGVRAVPFYPARPAPAPPRRPHGCWHAPWRRAGVCRTQQRCGVAAVAVLRLRPPGRRWWRGVPPWRCRLSRRGC